MLQMLATIDSPFLQMLLGKEPSLLLVIGWSLFILAAGFLPLVSIVGFIGIWAERKVAGRIQHRHGPNRVGPIGILQSLADGIKLVTKEDLMPAGSDKLLFMAAPYFAFAPVFAAFMVIPFGPDLIFEPKLSVGLFWMLAILSVEVIGIILAGWSSNNKWSIYGAMREACQLISYEIPLGLSIMTVIVATGSLDLIAITNQQLGGADNWLIFRQPFILLAAGVFFVASLASNKRAPFDLPESESELVAGYHTEYSGLRFSLFYLAEYNAMFVMSAVMAVLFLGSWDDPLALISKYYLRATTVTEKVIWNIVALSCFTLKVSTLIFVQMWVRWTLPRPRIDQVLHGCIKVMLPMSCVILFGSTVWEMIVEPGTTLFDVTRWTLTIAGFSIFAITKLWLSAVYFVSKKSRARLTEFSPL